MMGGGTHCAADGFAVSRGEIGEAAGIAVSLEGEVIWGGGHKSRESHRIHGLHGFVGD